MRNSYSVVLQPVSSVTNKLVISEVFYRESILSNRFPIKDFGNDERLVGHELTGCNSRVMRWSPLPTRTINLGLTFPHGENGIVWNQLAI